MQFTVWRSAYTYLGRCVATIHVIANILISWCTKTEGNLFFIRRGTIYFLHAQIDLIRQLSCTGPSTWFAVAVAEELAGKADVPDNSGAGSVAKGLGVT